MSSSVHKWEFDLSSRPIQLIDRCEATLRLAKDARRIGAHQTPSFARQAIAGSCISFAIEQQNSVGLLVATGRDSSAAVLVRPILESVCVSAWAVYCAENDQLTSIFRGQRRIPNLSSLISQLEVARECDWIGLKQRSLNVSAFHALAHPSMLHLSKRYSSDSSASAFSAEECIKLLWLADTLSVTCVGVLSVAMDSEKMESWAALEMGRLMSEQGVQWEKWKSIARSKMPLGPQTPIANQPA